jgi:hypothetical protein
MSRGAVAFSLASLATLLTVPSAARQRCSAAELRLAREAPGMLASQWADAKGAVRALDALRRYDVRELAPDEQRRRVYAAHHRCRGVAAFWRAVVRATRLGRCDMKLYRPALDAALEQARSDRSNMRQAVYYWRRRPPRDQCHGATGWYEETRAMMYLLAGQRDNPRMMNIYKACYRDHGLALIEAVAKRRPWRRRARPKHKTRRRRKRH